MTHYRLPLLMPRRSLLRAGVGAGTGLAVGSAGLGAARAQGAPAATAAVVTSDALRPKVPYGAMSGDVTADRAIVWSKTDRSARMIVEYSTTETFKDARRIVGPAALEDTDFTARVDLGGLPAGQQIFYRVVFQDLKDVNTSSAPVTGASERRRSRGATSPVSIPATRPARAGASIQNGAATGSTR